MRTHYPDPFFCDRQSSYSVITLFRMVVHGLGRDMRQIYLTNQRVIKYRPKGQGAVMLLIFFTFLIRQGILHQRAITVSLT